MGAGELNAAEVSEWLESIAKTANVEDGVSGTDLEAPNSDLLVRHKPKILCPEDLVDLVASSEDAWLVSIFTGD